MFCYFSGLLYIDDVMCGGRSIIIICWTWGDPKKQKQKQWTILQSPFFYFCFSLIRSVLLLKANQTFFFPMLVAVLLVHNYEQIKRRGTATCLLSKHFSCINIDNFKGIFLLIKELVFRISSYIKYCNAVCYVPTFYWVHKFIISHCM